METISKLKVLMVNRRETDLIGTGTGRIRILSHSNPMHIAPGITDPNGNPHLPINRPPPSQD
jgi:hypothetical protein